MLAPDPSPVTPDTRKSAAVISAPAAVGSAVRAAVGSAAPAAGAAFDGAEFDVNLMQAGRIASRPAPVDFVHNHAAPAHPTADADGDVDVDVPASNSPSTDIPAGADTSVPLPQAGPTRVRLAFLDDHNVLLDSITGWIGRNAPDFDVVLTGTNWGEFVHSPQFPGDLAILDYQLAEDISIESRVRTCRAAGAKVIVLSGLNTRETRERSLNAGASVFLSKDLPMAELMDAARLVMGIEQIPLTATQRAAAAIDHFASALPAPKLSEGELAALRLYATGVTVAGVATGMGVHYETAKTYLRRVREKYVRAGRIASKRTDLIRRAAEDGYLD